MDDLFRFVLLRPANLPDSTEVKVLEPPSIKKAGTRREARRLAARLLRSGLAVRSTEQLGQTSTALAVRDALAGGPVPAARLRDVISRVSGRSVEDLVADEAFAADEAQLADTLVATKLVSDSAGTDARGLGAVAQGYDAIRETAQGTDLVRLRPLAMPLFGTRAAEGDFPDRRLPEFEAVPVSADVEAVGEGEPDPLEESATRLQATLAALGRLRARDFEAPRLDASQPQAGTVAEDAGPTSSGSTFLDTPWKLAARAVERI